MPEAIGHLLPALGHGRTVAEAENEHYQQEGTGEDAR